MEFLSGYILSIVGIILVGVVVDLMLVDGQVKKYVQSIYVLFVIFTIVAPLPSFINNIKRGDFSLETSSITVDEKYLEIIKNQKNTALSNAIEAVFENDGFAKVVVSIDSSMVDKVYTINKVCVDISACPKCPSKTVIDKTVQKVVTIDEKDIIVYE